MSTTDRRTITETEVMRVATALSRILQSQIRRAERERTLPLIRAVVALKGAE